MKSFFLLSLLAMTVSKVSAQSLSYSAAATSFAVGSTLLVSSPFAENVDQKVIFDDCMDFYATGIASDDLQRLINEVRKDPRFQQFSDEQLIAVIMEQFKRVD